jgi:YidC/Oxa1 family membrane protein insertase
MDKRSLLAIVLTFAVMLGWYLVFVQPKQQEVAQRRMEQLREQAAIDSLAALERAAADSVEAPHAEAVDESPVEAEFTEGAVTEAPPVRLSLETEEIIVTLNSTGGEITSVRLLGYTTKDGALVELVPAGAAGGFAVSLLEADEWRRLSGVGFEVFVDGVPASDGDRIVLGEEREQATVLFRAEWVGGGTIEKGYTFTREGTEFALRVLVDREGALRRSEAYAVSWECGLSATERDVKKDTGQFAALARVGDENYKESVRSFSKERAKRHDGMIVWAGARTKYFLSALIPEQQREGFVSMLGDKAEDYVGYSVGYYFRGDPRRAEDTYFCYLGPLDMNTLKGYDIGLEKTIELGRLRFLSVWILQLMTFLYRFIPNYGVVIIIISILTKILFYRLTHKSFKSMKDMQRLQPKMKELQEKYKDDKKKQNEAVMKLYKEAGVNPLGGCLPLLLQMPVFIALFNVLRNTIELRGAPFVLWINDLSSPDVLFSFGTKLWLLGSDFHLLPILMGAAMVVQSKLGGSPTGGEAAPGQTKMMSTMMPIVFTVIFYGMPSGLVLYWFVNQLFSLVQQYVVHREIEAEELPAVAGEEEAGGTPEKSPPAKSAAKQKKRVKGGKKQSGRGKRYPYH